MENEKLTKDLFLAYYECRQNKRNTTNALKFEMNYESNLFKLRDELLDRTYEPRRSIAFIVTKPVKREIFAADFRDRIIHHFLIKKMNIFFEKTFIDDSYACRKGKGTHFGVKNIYNKIKECSKNYITDCFILKLDIEGFFMHINRDILYKMLYSYIQENYFDSDKDLIIFLTKKVIYNNPVKNCIIKGNKSEWLSLPKTKSLFGMLPGFGLPIGNLTSQVFANFYMNLFDKWILEKMNIKYYGRYVDDFIIIDNNRDNLISLIEKIKGFLNTNLLLNIHPKKIYLQHYNKGVAFLGSYIKPNRIYIKNSTKGTFFQKIREANYILNNNPNKNDLKKIVSSMNSYLGLFRTYKTFKLRKKMISLIDNKLNYISNIYNYKIILNKKL
jgi:RNA-directed DNA polymerase